MVRSGDWLARNELKIAIRCPLPFSLECKRVGFRYSAKLKGKSIELRGRPYSLRVNVLVGSPDVNKMGQEAQGGVL